MRGVNKVILIGNATRDAELHHTQTGKAVSAIRLATNRQVKGEEETQFHTIVCWDRLAETTAEYVKKGDPLYVEGRLTGKLPLTSKLLSNTDGTIGRYVTTGALKKQFGYPRPFLPADPKAAAVPGDSSVCAASRVNASSLASKIGRAHV